MLRPGRNSSGGACLPSYDGMTGNSYGASTSAAAYGGYQPQSSSSSTGQAYGGYSGGYTHTSTTQPPQQQYSGSFKEKSKYRSSSNSHPAEQVLSWMIQQLKQPLSWMTILSGILFCFMMQYRGQVTWMLQELHVTTGNTMQDVVDSFVATERRANNCQRDLNQKQATERRLKDQMTYYERENSKLQKEKNELMIKKDEYNNNNQVERLQREHMGVVDRFMARDEAWKEQVMLLQKKTKRESKRAAMEKFGPGPHHVKFTVLLPTDETETERSFIVEMAPLDVMPHAVHLFLEQVAHGLWDNAWFYLNGPHVLQAGPQVEEDEEELYSINGDNGNAETAAADERSLALKPFIDLELDTLAFPEYSDKHPHNKWTLGFTGRPGGPDFYINKMNNTEAHGPGGQHQHDLEEYADACFATVVEGFDVLELIFKEPTYPDDHDWGWFYEEPVHIVGARVMEKVLAPVVVTSKVSSNNNNTSTSTDNNESRRKPQKPLAKHKIDHQVIP